MPKHKTTNDKMLECRYENRSNFYEDPDLRSYGALHR
jgi:hypothetical protein